MTEAEWLACTHPWRLVDFFTRHADNRQLRLFSVAVCRRIERLIPPHLRPLLEVPEKFADGEGSLDDLAAVQKVVRSAEDAVTHEVGLAVCGAAALYGLDETAGWTSGYVAEAVKLGRGVARDAPVEMAEPVETSEQQAHAALARDIIGNLLLRPVVLDPAWLRWNDATVSKAAKAIYEGRRFEDMPILADALEEAGCSDPLILEHLRGPGPHVKGCWALDLLLGKATAAANPMDETQWQSCDDPDVMLDCVKGRASERKLRLLAVACCRRVSHLLTDSRGLRILEVSEAYADGRAGEQELSEASEYAVRHQSGIFGDHRARVGSWAWNAVANASGGLPLPAKSVLEAAVQAVAWSAFDATQFPEPPTRDTSDDHTELMRSAFGVPEGTAAVREAEQREQAALLRDVFGPLPFRSVTVEPSWRAPAVRTLAEAIYEQRTFERLPELAQALEEAGCDSEDILRHCREQDAHVRGCWVLDLLLDKV